MMFKPRRICLRGSTRPAARPDSQAPPMMPPIVRQKNQKNSVGASWSSPPSQAGADST